MNKEKALVVWKWIENVSGYITSSFTENVILLINILLAKFVYEAQKSGW